MNRKKGSLIPGLVVLAVFLLAFGFYAWEYLIPHGSSPQTGPTTTGPVTTAPGTTNPVVTTEPPVTIPPTTGIDPVPTTGYTVVLDPGHGFRDGGASSDYFTNGWTEKDFTLDMCRKIEEVLRAKGIKVLWSHDGTSFPSVQELHATAGTIGFRLQDYVKDLAGRFGVDKNGNPVNPASTWSSYANLLSDSGTGATIFNVQERAYYITLLARQEKVDAVVSVHVNSVDTSNPAVDPEKFSGYTVSYCNANGHASESAFLMAAVSTSLTNTFPSKRVVRYADPWYDSLVICKYSDAPTVLVETGYCVKADEAADLMNEAWRTRMAEAIAAGVCSYLGVQ